MRSEFSSSGFFLTILIAPAGQCLAQLPQFTLSLFTTQRSRSTEAVPTWIAVFSSGVISRIAPAGHTSEHFVHSGRHQPFSYDISGCISLSREVDGLRTSFGHCDTQSWHPVQCWWKCLRLTAPNGTIGFVLSGAFLAVTAAYPPSTFFSWALRAIAVAAITEEEMKARLPALS